MDEIANNRDSSAASPASLPDMHGEAALLLVESLIHALIERSALTVADAIGIVATAEEVRIDTAGDRGEPSATLQRSLGLLGSIRQSLETSLGETPR